MSNARRIEERFFTENVKGEWEPSSVRIPAHVVTAAEFARFVRELNKRAAETGEFLRFRSVETEDVF